MNIVKIIYAVLVSSLFAMAECFPQNASFQGLGDLPGGNFESFAKSISADGSVVVGSGNSDSGEQAFVWTKTGGIISLGNLADSSFKNSCANSVSGNGEVIVGYGDPVGTGWDTYKGFIWTNASDMVELGSLNGSTRFMAFSVSADGSIVVGDGGEQAFLWKQNEGIIGLGTLPGRSNSRAVAVSADGSIAVGSSYNSDWSAEETFRWTQEEGMQGLGFLQGTNYSFPNAISPDGTVIAGTSVSSSRSYAYRWSANTGMVNIGYLPGTYVTHPGGVSNNGTIIVGGSYVDAMHGQAFIWDSVNGMRKLQTVLQTEYGLNLSGWTLQNASGITPDGNVIVGFGTNPSGNIEAFRVVLDTLATDVCDDQHSQIIDDYNLEQNYPNPFNPSTTINYRLSTSGNVKLNVYNLLGQKVKTLIDSFQISNRYSIVWSGTDDSNNPVSSGIYFYRFETKNNSMIKKMLLMR